MKNTCIFLFSMLFYLSLSGQHSTISNTTFSSKKSISVVQNKKTSGNYLFNTFNTTEQVLLSIPVFENFDEENKPAGWLDFKTNLNSEEIPVPTIKTWLVSKYLNKIENTNALTTNLFGNYNILCTSPRIVVGSEDHTDTLEFDIAITRYYSQDIDTLDLDDTLAVLISADGKWSKKNILYLITHKDSLGNGRHVKIDISNYSDTIQIGFWGKSSTKEKDNDIFIDNLRISRVNVLSQDASLSSLMVNDSLLTNFSQTTTHYNYILPAETTEIAVVTATATDKNASVEITNASQIDGMAIITITAEDKKTVQTYTIDFEIESLSADNSIQDVILVYPNPVREILHFNKTVERGVIIDITGVTVQTIHNINEVNVGNLSNGIYLIKIHAEGKDYIRSIIKK